MSFPGRFSSSNVLRRLGIVDPQAYDLASQPITPTAQILDLSRSVSTEPFEGRGIGGFFVAAGAGESACVQLQCRAPGGCVIEFVQAMTAGATGGIHVRVSNTPGAFTFGGTLAGVAQIGGLATLSSLRWGRTTAAASPGLFAVGADAAVIPIGTNMSQRIGERWFVGAGETFEMGQSDLAADFDFAVQWRELA